MPTLQEVNAWAEAQYLKEKLAKLEGKPYSPTSTAGARFEGHQEAAKWQEPFEAHGRVVPPQHEGESLNVYRIRLASMMQEYSREWAKVNLHEAPSFMVDNVLGEIRPMLSNLRAIAPIFLRASSKKLSKGMNRVATATSSSQVTKRPLLFPKRMMPSHVASPR